MYKVREGRSDHIIYFFLKRTGEHRKLKCSEEGRAHCKGRWSLNKYSERGTVGAEEKIVDQIRKVSVLLFIGKIKQFERVHCGSLKRN